jgi:hypothetical protein
MKKHILIQLILLLFVAYLPAQTAKQAEKLFEQGEYEKAKEAYRKLIRTAPNNAGYNYFLGASLYELGEKEEALPYLEKSAKRKYINAYRHLGKLYFDLHRYDEAIENYETHIEWLEEKDRETETAEEELAFIRHYIRMLKGVEKVTVIDSIVVPKNEFLKTYQLSKEAGQLTMKQGTAGTMYENERGNKRLYADSIPDGTMQLYNQVKLLDEWEEAEPIASINQWGNVNYPFLMGDGVTLYFASDTEGSLGGYDIYVTRYDSEDNEYLKPSNMGMPFNSTANDYMMAIDEFNHLGWFASDRNQPQDSVCIYVFIPNESKQTYNYENTGIETIIDAATLRNIQKTWENASVVEVARQRLADIRNMQTSTKQEMREFTFIVNDRFTYHKYEDFRSKQASNRYRQLKQKQEDLKELSQSLAEKRTLYSFESSVGKEKLAPSILDLEKRIPQLEAEIEELTIEVRNLEIQQLNK